MSSRSKVIIPYKVEKNPNRIRTDTGIPREDWIAILDKEQLEQIRQGYACLNCLESPLTLPFPERCPVCGYAIRDRQSEDFAKNYDSQGRHVGPSTTIEEELDRLDDFHERRIHKSGGQILIPRSVKIDGAKVRATGRLHKF